MKCVAVEETWLAGVSEGAWKKRLVPATPRILVVHGLAVRALPEQNEIGLVFSAAPGALDVDVPPEIGLVFSVVPGALDFAVAPAARMHGG